MGRMPLNREAHVIWLLVGLVCPVVGGWASSHEERTTPIGAGAFPRDSIVVDGQRIRFVADVQVDTTAFQTMPADADWWFGVSWEVQLASRSSSSMRMSTLDVLPNRPSLRLERQHVMQKGRGKMGFFVEHSQPWTFDAEEVSEFAKGWIWSGGQGARAPVQQVVLTPDSLAFERDTVMAPLSPGHALRLGASWEGQVRHGWRPRLAASAYAWRPFGWSLEAPGDPNTWMGVEAENTYTREAMWRARMRLEAGLVLDLGESYPGARAAGQFRVDAFWLPGSIWGLAVSFLASPTRR